MPAAVGSCVCSLARSLAQDGAWSPGCKCAARLQKGPPVGRSRCVYNYTLGNRILSVCERRMFWQLLGVFENSLRKQLWIPSPSLPRATTRALGHDRPAVPRRPDWPLPSAAALETPAAPAVSPPPPRPSLCHCVEGGTCSPQLEPGELNEPSRWLGGGAPGLTPKSQPPLTVPTSKGAGNSP